MLTLITPTGDRPVSFNLTIDFMLSQVTREPIEWIVVDDGITPAIQEVLKKRMEELTQKMSVRYCYRTPSEEETKSKGPKSLAANLLMAISRVRGDKVFIIEDDDWYSPIYLHKGSAALAGFEAYGTVWQCYYNLEQLTYKVLRNKGSALCSTCFRADLLPVFEEICRDCYDTNFKGIDYTFWKKLEREGKNILIDPVKNYYCIGMKSLPGRKGIGIGHIGKRFYPDTEQKRLKKWVGEQWAETYLEIRDDMLRRRSGST